MTRTTNTAPPIDLQAVVDADATAAQAAADQAQLDKEKARVQGKAAATAKPTDAELEAAAAELREQEAAARKDVGTQYYRALHGQMIDPETQKVFNVNEPTRSTMTSWLSFQIENQKISLDEAE